jgi:hypothetical protein
LILSLFQTFTWQRIACVAWHEESLNLLLLVRVSRPFNNPTETYRYYSLPFCFQHATAAEEQEVAEMENVVASSRRETESRKGAQRIKHRLGEHIVGDRRETSPYEITFQDSVDWRLLCKTELKTKDLEKFKDAIHKDYFFEFFIEDLPMWGYIGDATDEDLVMGEVDGTKTFLFPHLHFVLGFNGDQIVSTKVTTDVSCMLIRQGKRTLRTLKILLSRIPFLV